jgi:hypothetical protein
MKITKKKKKKRKKEEKKAYAFIACGGLTGRLFNDLD